MGQVVDLYGVYLPILTGLALIAYVFNSSLKRALLRCNFYRFVWHPPLFNTASYLIILWALSALTRIH
nr:DUF1656 domain-containing protein [uncultured Desulfuromonas sp.]